MGITPHSCPLGTPHVAGEMLSLPVSSQHLTSEPGALASPAQLLFSQASWAESRAGTPQSGAAHPSPRKARALPLLFAPSATSW